MPIQVLIAAVNDRLTPIERRIAEVVLDDPTLLAFGTVSDLAGRAETSRPSIVRFATKLGFDGYTDLQSQIRSEFSQQLTSPSHRVRQDHSEFEATRRAVEEATDHTLSVLDETMLASLAEPIARARRVWIISGETSMAGAYTLYSGLSMVRPDVLLIQEHLTGRDLSGAAPGDTAVVFDFARYRRSPITIARMLADLGVEIVAVTDGPLSPLASLTKAWCALRIPAVGPFDSSIPAVTASELIVSTVVDLLGDSARDRIDQLEQIWQTTGTFLNYSPRSSRNPANS